LTAKVGDDLLAAKFPKALASDGLFHPVLLSPFTSIGWVGPAKIPLQHTLFMSGSLPR
jgi:hypothetical protein